MTTAELRRLLAEATPGPWRVRKGYGPDKFSPKGYKYVQFGPTEKKANGYGTSQLLPADAALIVAAVNLLPAHLDVVAAAEAHLRRVGPLAEPDKVLRAALAKLEEET